MFLDDLLLAQVFSNFTRAMIFNLSNISWGGVYLTSEKAGEISLEMELDRSRFVSILSRLRSPSRHAKAKPTARERKNDDGTRGNCKWIIRPPQEAAQIHQGRCLEKVWLALPLSSARLYFQNSERGKRKSTCLRKSNKWGTKSSWDWNNFTFKKFDLNSWSIDDE